MIERSYFGQSDSSRLRGATGPAAMTAGPGVGVHFCLSSSNWTPEHDIIQPPRQPATVPSSEGASPRGNLPQHVAPSGRLPARSVDMCGEAAPDDLGEGGTAASLAPALVSIVRRVVELSHRFHAGVSELCQQQSPGNSLAARGHVWLRS